MVIGRITIDLETGLLAEIITNTEEEETIMVIEITEIIGPIIETTAGPEIEIITGMAIGIIIDQTTDETIVTKGIEIEILVKTVVDLETEKEREIGVAQEKAPIPEVEIKVLEIKTGMETGDKIGMTQEIDPSQGQDQVPM